MPNWIPLKEVLQNHGKYGNVSEIPVNYTPDYSTITLRKEQTGVTILQLFETETDHIWHIATHMDEMYLITSNVTKQKLSLCGEIGYENSEQVQREISHLFGNKALGTTGEIWTEETIGMLGTLPKFLSEANGRFWTNIKYKYPYDIRHCYLGLYMYYYGTLYGKNKGDGNLYLTSGESLMDIASVRPLVHLPSDILIDTSELDMGVSLTLMNPNIAGIHNKHRKVITSSKSYVITEEELKALEDLASWHKEKADAILALIKKIKQN